MFKDDILACSKKVDEEQQQADAAPSMEAGMIHSQMAMLYKAELAMLYRRQRIHEQSLIGSASAAGYATGASNYLPSR